MNNIRIRTNVGDNNFLKVKLEQDFDFLEILSLKISQEDVYRRFYSDYGVVVGRVIINNGLGVPNAKVSIFIPLSDDDSNNIELSTIYPYKNFSDTNVEGIRYNLLPNHNQTDCHVPVGTFPSKREVLDNGILFEVFDKYYKFTTTTNNSGDFMLFGIPVGNHMLHVDVDLSDIGIYSQRPYDFIEQGNPSRLFKSASQFNTNKNLNNLTQIKSQRVGVNVIPFWGETLDDEVGITRIDMDLNYNLRPSAIFMGSIFGDNEKNSVNKNCRPRKKLGRICDTVAGGGTINMIRKTFDGEIEKFDIQGGKLIDDYGTWAYQIPMNLDYMVTDEFGELVPSETQNKGIPTRTRVRFKIAMDNTGGQGRLRTRAKFLVPHNPTNANEVDYELSETTKDLSFRDLFWNKIYTVKNHITRLQTNCTVGCADVRNMVGIKDVDDCVGTKNPFPFNRLDGDFNPIFTVICLILGIIITILRLVNVIFSSIACLTIRIPVVRVTIIPFKRLFKCVTLSCDGDKYAPGCQCGSAQPSGTSSTSADDLHECYKILLAESLNLYELDFYNDWVNGTLFSFLLKYKKRRGGDKFCSTDRGQGNYIVNTLEGSLKSIKSEHISRGYIKGYKNELFYSPYDLQANKLLFPTDIVSLGPIFDCDWQGGIAFHELLTPTSYKIPPLVNNEPEVTSIAGDGSPSGLLFDFTCISMSTNGTQINNIRRLCELGVGLDEDRSDEPNGGVQNGVVDDDEIDNKFVRDAFIVANSNLTLTSSNGLNSGFYGSDYNNFRNFDTRYVKQSRGNSFYMYFGTEPNNSAIDKMNNNFFPPCYITSKPKFNVTATLNNTTFLSGNNGSIIVSVNGGSAPYSYVWSNGSITQSISGLTAGSYTVEVTDNNGDIVIKTFTIVDPFPITFSSTMNPTSTASSNDGSICINSILGGNGVYTLTLTPPVGSPTTIVTPTLPYCFTSLGNGDYTVNIVDTSLIPIVTSGIISVTPPPPLVLTTRRGIATCYSDNSDTLRLEISGGIPPYSATTIGPSYKIEELANPYSLDVVVGGYVTTTSVSNFPFPNTIDILFGGLYTVFPSKTQLSGTTQAYTSNLINQGPVPSGNYTITIVDSFYQQLTRVVNYPVKTQFYIAQCPEKRVTLPSPLETFIKPRGVAIFVEPKLLMNTDINIYVNASASTDNLGGDNIDTGSLEPTAIITLGNSHVYGNYNTAIKYIIDVPNIKHGDTVIFETDDGCFSNEITISKYIIPGNVILESILS